MQPDPMRGAAPVRDNRGERKSHQGHDDSLDCTNWYTSSKARRPGAGKPRGLVAEYVDGRERVLGRGRIEFLVAELVAALDGDIEAVVEMVGEVRR